MSNHRSKELLSSHNPPQVYGPAGIDPCIIPAVAALPVSILPDGLRPLRSAHGGTCNSRICARSIPSQVAFSSQRLLLVFPIDPSTNDTFCIRRIGSGSETNNLISLWASVGCQHLVPGACDPARWRIMATVDFAP